MKRLMLAAILAASAAAAFADESVDVYRWLYRQAGTFPEQDKVLTEMASKNDPALAPVLAEGLRDMVRLQASMKTMAEREAMSRLLRTLLASIGEYKYLESAEDCWAVVQSSQDPLTRAEAFMALGAMRALDYSERIALFLTDLNANQWADKEAAEKVAYGCILALEKLRDIRGFKPLFFAANGWYGKRVRDQAAASLAKVTDDPTDPILELIRLEPAELKLVALVAEFNSAAPTERKIAAAIQALTVAREQAGRDKRESIALATVRTQAMKGLVSYKAKDDAAVGPLSDSLKLGEMDERLLALSVLGSMGTDASARLLSDYLIELNEAQKRGVTDENRDRLAKAAILNAGLSGNAILRPALLAIQNTSSWSGGILQAAAESLKALR